MKTDFSDHYRRGRFQPLRNPPRPRYEGRDVSPAVLEAIIEQKNRRIAELEAENKHLRNQCA